MEGTRKVGGNLEDKELENLIQPLEYETRLEKLELELRMKKKIQKVRKLFEQEKKMDKSQHLQKLVDTGETNEDTYEDT